MEFWKYKVLEVRDIYDGDTLRLVIDLGFGITHRGINGRGQPFRLNRIDTPEIRGDERPDGLIAKDALINFIAGCELAIESIKDGNDKYGRYICELYALKGECWVNVNDWLVENGYASYVEY